MTADGRIGWAEIKSSETARVIEALLSFPVGASIDVRQISERAGLCQEATMRALGEVARLESSDGGA